MKRLLHSYNKTAQLFGLAISLATAGAVYGAFAIPVAGVAVTASTVTIAQQPLTLQPSVPPDVVLMLDDSGSMNWDVMPDYSYLSDTSASGLTDPVVNGVYYNPAVTYVIPPHANGTAFATPSFSSAPVNGFDASSATVDLASYRGAYDSYDVNYYGTPVQYSVSVAKTGATPYAASSACPAGTAISGGAQPGYCYYSDRSSPPTGPVSFFDTGNGYFYVSRCKSVGDLYNNSTGQCTPGISFFTYTTGSVGSYVTHYVAENTGDCAAVGLSTSVCDESPVSRQNVADWFAYYHTRILMAKSGLMVAFSTLDPAFRVGFGSINGNNVSTIRSLDVSSYPFSTDTDSHNKLAEVAPFGAPTDATGQRFNLWTWIESETASGGTPLREALAAVGSYYSATGATSPTGNAWVTMSSDPGYSATGTNSPIACRQAYTILTTDGFWNGSYSSTTTQGASDNSGPTVTGQNGQSYTYNAALPYSGGDTDDGSPSLADVAMYYWKNDLQSGLTNEVPPSTDDPAFWQHMVTFTMGLGFTPVGIKPAGTTTQQIFDWANGGTAISNFSWPTPSASNGGSQYNIADLEHAGVNGHGGFFSATDPDSFINGIQTALKRATERVGTGASLAANSTQLTTGTVIYQADYYTSTWKGDLMAFSVNAATGAISTTPTWQASKEMPGPTSRDIETWNGTGFVAFKNGASAPPSLSTAQLNLLGSTASAQEAMVNYLRGDNTAISGSRERDTPLGDIVDSQPVYSGAPNPNEFVNQTFNGVIPDPTTKSIPFYDWAVGTTDASGTFTASAASQRTPLIFVAANDGMLHAFNATTGAEVFAYLPGAVLAQATNPLANLANPAYGSAGVPHQFYNDGQLTIADAYVQLSGDSSPQWHTILVGTTGRGLARAIYALDITDPSNIKPLWERSANDAGVSGDSTNASTYIGQMVGKPVIAQTNNVAASGGTPASSTWSVLMGNGYNSPAGVAALLQFNLATGALSVHTTTDATAGNGLAAPVAWMDNPGDGVSDIAYAGDLHGHVWSFQLNDPTGANPTPTSTGSLLFTTQQTEPNGANQPITAGMLAGMDSTTGNLWLFFGTGEYLNSADLTDTSTQSWYGLIVRQCTTSTGKGKNATPVTTCAPLSAPITLSQLVQRTITGQTAGGGGSLPARTVSSPGTNAKGQPDMTGMLGWYMNLLAPVGTNNAPVNQGERMVDPNEFQGSLLIGVTRIPKVTDICNPSGSGWIMALNPFTGTAPSDNFFDTNGDGYVNAGDRVNGSVAAGVGFGSLPNAPIFVGGIMETSFDNGTTSSLKTAGTVGTMQRVNWTELVNQ